MSVEQRTAPSEPFESASTYLNASQVAELVGVDSSTIFRWASSFVDMPVLRVGGVVRFNRTKLLAWLQAHEQGSRRRPRVQQMQSPGNAARTLAS